MTAEVVVMNRVGVALAADSAVTVQAGDSSKVRDSAMKLFTLSKYCPVGVMVYNNSSLLGVPWETIIKLFRSELGRKRLDRLTDYGEALIKFLDNSTSLFPDDVQDRYYLRALDREYRRIDDLARKRLIDRAVYSMGGEEEPSDVQVDDLFEAVDEALEEWRGKAPADYFRSISEEKASPEEELTSEEEMTPGEEMAGRKSAEVSERIHEVFADWKPGPAVVEKLREIAKHLIDKDDFPPDVSSGIVIAGFGEEEHFPSMQHIEMGGIYGGRLKVRPPEVERVSHESPSHVSAFAYSEMVENFLYGISKHVFQHLENAATFIREMPVVALNAAPDLAEGDRQTVEGVVRRASARMAGEFARRVLAGLVARREGIATAVEALTILELGEAASTLVSMSSFQQQMSLGRETVGGPVDVAVISKGDGFIWINRKHYFRKELNSHFFRNYYNDRTKDSIKVKEPLLNFGWVVSPAQPGCAGQGRAPARRSEPLTRTTRRPRWGGAE